MSDPWKGPVGHLRPRPLLVPGVQSWLRILVLWISNGGAVSKGEGWKVHIMDQQPDFDTLISPFFADFRLQGLRAAAPE